MKKLLINIYYDLLMLIEDIFNSISSKINIHRKTIDIKYYDKYIKPNSKYIKL